MPRHKRASSTIIDELRFITATQPRGTVALAYHYFDFRELSKTSSECLILSLISHLLDQSLTVPTALFSLYEQCHGRRSFSLNDLKSTLREMLLCFEHTYIVIDALDESSDEQWGAVANFLDDIFEWSSMVGAHLLVTSRPEPRIQRRLECITPADCQVNLGCEAGLSEDIRLYVRSAIHDSKSSFQRWKPDILREIEDTLVHRANGMYVALHLSSSNYLTYN